MVTSRQDEHFSRLLKEATDFHGHFGPFLTLGVRMGLVGIRELGVESGDKRLHVRATLEYALPFSCMLDGIQTSTGCTIGNKRLTWSESEQIGVEFLIKNKIQRVKVEIKSAIIQELRSKLQKTLPTDEVVRQLAIEIGSRPEKELFSVRHE